MTTNQVLYRSYLNRTVALFRKHSAIGMSCNTPLPYHMWRKFNSPDIHLQSHHLSESNYNEGVYKIVTKLRINDTCGSWKIEKSPYCLLSLAKNSLIPNRF